MVARIVPADDLFTLTSRSVLVPAGWAALVTRSGQDPLLVRAGDSLENDAGNVLFVRTTPIECVADESALRSADGFECRGSIRARVRVMAEPAELSAFTRTVIGSTGSVSVADLQRYLYWQMGEVLAELAARLNAEALLQPLDASTVQGIVEDKLGATCLAGGLAIDRPVAVDFSSPAYREHCRLQARADQAKRRSDARLELQKARAAAQRERLTHLVAMLEQMNDAIVKHPGLSITEILQAFSEADRSEFYAAQWHLCPSERATRFVAAASGPELLLYEPGAFGRPARRIRLSGDLGLLRSVTVDARSLEAGIVLIGAARGVHVLDTATGEVQRSLAADVGDTASVRGGVNAAAMSDDHVYATHSELGLLAWRRGGIAGERSRQLRSDLTSGADTVRCVQVAELQLWFAVDETLFSLPLEDNDAAEPVRYTASAATLSAVTVAAGMIYAGNVDGQIIAWDVGEPESARVVRGQAGAPVESIDVVQTGGVDRLIVADRRRALLAMVVGDNYSCRYESPSQIVRRAVAADDVFVAMNDNRDRLIVWSPGEPKQPAATVIVPHLTGSTVQDICLIPVVAAKAG